MERKREVRVTPHVGACATRHDDEKSANTTGTIAVRSRPSSKGVIVSTKAGAPSVATDRSSTRRWPAALACFALVCALALTGALFNLDRENVADASSSPANAARDSMARTALSILAVSYTRADQFHREGVLGLRQVATHELRALVVNPLGGTFYASPTSWTLALNGGWACLSLLRTERRLFVPEVSRGVCGDTVIQATPSVSTLEFRRAMRQALLAQRASLDAAVVSAALSSTSTSASPDFTPMALAGAFGRVTHSSFTSAVTIDGIVVRDGASSACVQPTATQDRVVIESGECPSEGAADAG